MSTARPLRIALVAGSFPKLSETFVLQQITSLIELGHDVRIFAFDRPQESFIHPEVTRLGLLERTTYLNSPKHVLTFWRWLVHRTFRRQTPEYDAIVCHFGPIGEFARRLRNMGLWRGKLAVFFHAYDLTAWFKKHPPSFYDALFAEADLLLPISEFWQVRLRQMGAPADKLRVLRMGVDCAELRYAPRTLEPGEPLRLISVARLIEKKGLVYALEAIASARSRIRMPLEYHVIGDGPLRAELENTAHSLGLHDVVRFWGALDSAGVARHMESVHALLAPSVTAADGDMEGIPVALMEAMARGIPVFSTRHSGIPELVRDGETGVCVPERDAPALTEALVDWANAPASWPAITARARALVEAEFDADKLARRLVDELRGVV